MDTVTVDASALRKVLESLHGPDYLIRELQAISNLPGYDCPIKKLTSQYNDAVERYNTQQQQATTNPDIC